MIDYQIAIPSFQRVGLLMQATLPCLKRHKADFSKITIFVADQKEYKKYEAGLKLLNLKFKIVVGKPGIGKQRIFINNCYPKGTRILSLDDDIFSLHEQDGKRLKPCNWDLDKIVFKGFNTCEKSGARMWGINPVFNGFFLKQTTTVGLRYICANFFGSYAQDPVWGKGRLDFSRGEDFEASLLSFKLYKGVVRLDGICPKTKYFAEGGIQAELGGKKERDLDHLQKLKEIVSRYPAYARLYFKKGDVPNIRLKTVTHGKVKWF